jgi:hypothetical protein
MSLQNFRDIGDQDLQPLTGKSWKEWCDLLDAWDDEVKNLSAITTHLMKHYELRRLYAQMIAVYYKWEWRTPQYIA